MDNTDAYFDTRLSYEPGRDAIWKPIVGYLQRYIPENARVLELGAGYCCFINQVKASEKHALDKSDIIKKYAASDVKIFISDVMNLRVFESGSYDVVFSSFLFEHLTREQLNFVMHELRRILRTGGVLITLLPNYKLIYRHYFDDYTHIQVFSHVSFSDYLRSQGFDLQTVQARFLPFSFKSSLPKSAFLARLYLRLPWRPFAGNMMVVATNPMMIDRSRLEASAQAVKEPATGPIPTAVLKDHKTQPGQRHPPFRYRPRRPPAISTDGKPRQQGQASESDASGKQSHRPHSKPPRRRPPRSDRPRRPESGNFRQESNRSSEKGPGDSGPATA